MIKAQKVEVLSAIPLNSEETLEIKKKLAASLASPFELKNVAAKDILGGLKIKIDGRIIDDSLKDKLTNLKPYSSPAHVYSEGKILTLGDGIAQVSGLPEALSGELLEFPSSIKGLVFNLEEDKVGVIILGDFEKLKEGDRVVTTGKILSIPAGEDFLGRLVNPLGEAQDGLKTPLPQKLMPLERIAPSVVKRQPVKVPLQTGIKAIDSLIPIGRGQRELIIGDRSTGKTTIAVDTIINQVGKNVICIYVAIGQKANRIAKIYQKLKEFDALKHTIIISANAADPVSLQYIAPFAGCSIAEYFMEKGKDILVVYDDLTKHAWAYRQLSLLLKRPSGREAYPGDIFYLHSRLLERACCLNQKSGGGTMTALPIVETQAGDISSYIPTNIISITDGQIYLESELFFAGIRPALNIGLSVSRVGGNAQIKAMKQVAGKLRLDLAQYRELAAFTQFTTDLDQETKKKIEIGSRISEIFKQPQASPLPVGKEVVINWAVTQGHLDEIPVQLIKVFEEKFLSYLDGKAGKILAEIEKTGELSEKNISALTKIINNFKKEFLKEGSCPARLN